MGGPFKGSPFFCRLQPALFLIKRDMWFRKKKKKTGIDLSDYDIILSIKSICMYERLSGKSFFNFMEEDMGMLLYCSFYVTNNVEIRYETFIGMLEVEDITKWAVDKYKNILEVIQQFKPSEEEDTEVEGNPEEDIKKLTMTDMATSLIIDYHMDAHYVMYEMRLWEIEPMYRACEAAIRRRYEEERLWTYIDVMPHIDGKKIKGPADLLPFPWEKDSKTKAQEDLKKNSAAAVAFLTRKKE